MKEVFVFVTESLGWLDSCWVPPSISLSFCSALEFFSRCIPQISQLRFFGHALKVVRGKYDKEGAVGDATLLFSSADDGDFWTVGTGNIGGVALAIYLGGPAALFWMWMTAFFGMTTKFVEVTLSHKYRTVDANGFIAGGPMYVMERRLNMKWLAVFFAIATVVSSFGTGNMPQSNNIASGIESTFGIPVWLTGAVLAILLGLVSSVV